MSSERSVKVAVVHDAKDDSWGRLVTKALKLLQDGGLITIDGSAQSNGSLAANIRLVLDSEVVLFLVTSKLVTSADMRAVAQVAVANAAQHGDAVVVVPIEQCFWEYTPLAGLSPYPSAAALSASGDQATWLGELASAIEPLARAAQEQSARDGPVEAWVTALRREIAERERNAQPLDRQSVERIMATSRKERQLTASDILMLDGKRHYRLLAELTQGGAGRLTRVWDGYDQKARLPVVIKSLNLSEARSDAERAKMYGLFYRCKRISEGPDSTLVRRLEGPRQEQGVHYYVMPRLARGSLATVIDEMTDEGKTLSKAQLFSILSRVAKAIDQLHQSKLIHSAVSLEAILLDESFNAYLGGLDALSWAQVPKLEDNSRAGMLPVDDDREPRKAADDLRAFAAVAEALLKHVDSPMDARDALQRARDGQYAKASDLVRAIEGRASGQGKPQSAGSGGSARISGAEFPRGRAAPPPRTFADKFTSAGIAIAVVLAVVIAALLVKRSGMLQNSGSGPPGPSAVASGALSGTGTVAVSSAKTASPTAAGSNTAPRSETTATPQNEHSCAKSVEVTDALKDPVGNTIGKLALLPERMVVSAGSVNFFKKEGGKLARDGAPRGEVVSDYGFAVRGKDVLQVWSQRDLSTVIVLGDQKVAAIEGAGVVNVAISPATADAVDVIYGSRKTIWSTRVQTPSGKMAPRLTVQSADEVQGEIYFLNAYRGVIAWAARKDQQADPNGRTLYLNSEVRVLPGSVVEAAPGAAKVAPLVLKETGSDISAVLVSGKRVWWAASGGYAKTALGADASEYRAKCNGGIRYAVVECAPGQQCSGSARTLALHVRQKDGSERPLTDVRPLGLAVSPEGEPIYWADACGAVSGAGKFKVYASWLDGQTELIAEDTGFSEVIGIPIALEDEAIYWTTSTPFPTYGQRGMVRRAEPGCR